MSFVSFSKYGNLTNFYQLSNLISHFFKAPILLFCCFSYCKRHIFGKWPSQKGLALDVLREFPQIRKSYRISPDGIGSLLSGWVRPLKSRKRRILSQKLWNLLGRDWFLATLVFPRVASPTTASAPLPRLQLQRRDLRQTQLRRMCEARIDKRSNAPPTSVRQFFFVA